MIGKKLEGEKLNKTNLLFPSASTFMSWEIVEKCEGAVISPTPSFALFQ